MTDTRREALAALGAASFAAVAGCLGGSGGSGGEAATPIDEHPVGAGLADQPSLGPEDAPATVVAFEDPSCPTCRAFELNAGSRLKEGPVADGTLRFVARSFPIIYPWGEPATQALEATYAREEAAFWGLFEYYFATQDEFNEENVLARTEAWLEANTDLDAAGVVADADAKAYDDAVQADLEAGRAAGVDRTPTLFLFRGGTYVTRASGNVSYDTIASALQL